MCCVCMHVCLSQYLFAVKRHHDQRNSYKRNLMGWIIDSSGSCLLGGIMVVYMKSCDCTSILEFYIWIFRHQDEIETEPAWHTF